MLRCQKRYRLMNNECSWSRMTSHLGQPIGQRFSTRNQFNMITKHALLLFLYHWLAWICRSIPLSLKHLAVLSIYPLKLFAGSIRPGGSNSCSPLAVEKMQHYKLVNFNRAIWTRFQSVFNLFVATITDTIKFYRHMSRILRSQQYHETFMYAAQNIHANISDIPNWLFI